MTDQRLYIDGELVDLGEDTKFTLSIKSNLFREISDIVSNNSYTIKLPKTVHNQRILGHSDLVQNGGSTYPYAYHTAEYFRNGVQLIRDGRATVMSISEQTFNLSIVWGINQALEDIIDNNLKLNELTNDAHIQYLSVNYPEDYDTAMQRGYYYADYNPFIDSNDYDWTTISEVRHQSKSKTIELEYGAIETPPIWNTVTFHIDKTVENYKCAIIPLGLGDNVLISNAYASNNYRLWFCIDYSGKVIMQSDASNDSQSVVTPSGSLDIGYVIVNIDSSLSPNAEVVLRTTNSDFADGSSSADKFPQITYALTRPCVNVSWILEQITADTGISFIWSGEAKNLINTLSIPLIKRDGDSGTYSELMLYMDIQNSGKLGLQQFMVREGGIFFDKTTDFVSSIQAKTSGKIYFSANASWDFNVEGKVPDTPGHGGTTRYYTFTDCYLVIRITHNDDNKPTDEYVVGSKGYLMVSEDSVLSNTIAIKQYASGNIEIEQYDIITFELKNDTGTPIDLFYNFSLIGIPNDDQEVPIGGMYPIVKNLPEIEVVDMLKFLCAITGTFPIQVKDKTKVQFAEINEIWGNLSQPVDWSEKLISYNFENKPKSLEFSLDDYARRNFYKWKEDELTQGYYDGCLIINNDTLEANNDVFEFPFAASDNNIVPLISHEAYTGLINSSPINNGETTSTNETVQCEDRIMNAYRDSNGKVSLRFDMNMQNIIDNKYSRLANTLSSLKVVKETILLSDIDIMEFDETKPVFLAQYGAYFAVTEIQVNEDGTSDVTMFQLVKVN